MADQDIRGTVELRDEASSTLERIRAAVLSLKEAADDGKISAEEMGQALSGLVGSADGAGVSLDDLRSLAASLAGESSSLVAEIDALQATLDSAADSSAAASEELSNLSAANSDAASSMADVSSEASQAASELDSTTQSISDYAAEASQAEGASTEFGEGLQDLGSDIRSTKQELLSLGAVAAGVDMAAAFIEDEASVIRVKTALRALGDVTEEEIERTMDLIQARMSLGFADDDLRAGYMRLLLITNDHKVALDLLTDATDVARGADMDLVAASRLVGMTYEGNYAALSRWGIKLDENATRTEALDALQARFANQAQAYAESHAGSAAKMTNAMGEVQESVGGGLVTQMDAYGAILGTAAGKQDDATASMGTLQQGAEAFGSILAQVAAGPAGEFLELVGLFQTKSAELAAQMPEDFTAATAGFADIPAGMRLVVEEGEYILLDMEGNIVATGEAIKEYATDAGMGYTNNFVGELEAGQAAIDNAAQANLAAMDVTEQAGELGIDIGRAYSRMEAGGVKELRPRISAEVRANNAVLAAGLDALNAYRQALGAAGIGKQMSTPGAGAAGDVFTSAGIGGLRGAQSSPAVRREAARQAREAFNAAADDTYSGTDELIGDSGLGRSSRAKAAPKAKKGAAAKKGAKGKSAEQLEKDRTRAAEAVERANDRLDAAAEALFTELPMQQAIEAATDDLTAAQERLSEAREHYGDLLDAERDKLTALAAEEKHASAGTITMIDAWSDALESMQQKHEAAQHDLQVQIHETEEALESLEAQARTALAPLEAEAKDAAEALEEIQTAAAAAAERSSQAMWPLQDQLYDIENQAEATLGAYDDQLTAIGDQLYALAEAEHAALDPLQARIDAQAQIVDSYREEADAIGRQIDLLRQQEDAHNRLNDLQDQGTSIRNLQARLANQGLSDAERAGLTQELTEAQRQYGAGQQVHQLTGQQEAANEQVRLAEEELAARQEAYDKRAAQFAEEREVLQLQQQQVERQREMAQRDFDQRRETIAREMERIDRDAELTARKYHLEELAAQNRADAANQAVEDETARQDARMQPIKDRQAALAEELSDMQHRDREDERLMGLEIGRQKARLAAIQEHYGGRREAINADILLLQGHQKTAEEAAGAEVEAAKGVLQPLKDAYEAWKDTNKERHLYNNWLDAVAGKDKALNALSTAEGTLATKAAELGAATKDSAAPGIAALDKSVSDFMDSEGMKELLASLDRDTEGTLAHDFVHAWDGDLEDSYKKLFATSLHDMGNALDLYRDVAGPIWEEIASDANTAMDSMIGKMGELASAYDRLPPDGDGQTGQTTLGTGFGSTFYTPGSTFGTNTYAPAYASNGPTYAPNSTGGGTTVINMEGALKGAFPNVTKAPTSVQELRPMARNLLQAIALEKGTVPGGKL